MGNIASEKMQVLFKWKTSNFVNMDAGMMLFNATSPLSCPWPSPYHKETIHNIYTQHINTTYIQHIHYCTYIHNIYTQHIYIHTFKRGTSILSGINVSSISLPPPSLWCLWLSMNLNPVNFIQPTFTVYIIFHILLVFNSQSCFVFYTLFGYLDTAFCCFMCMVALPWLKVITFAGVVLYIYSIYHIKIKKKKTKFATRYYFALPRNVYLQVVGILYMFWQSTW